MNTTETCYLFFDFDGTVYLGGEHIPTENLDAMRRAQKMGHKLILHTGRSYGALFRSPCVFEVPWDGMILGAAEYHYEGRVIHRESVSYDEFLVWLTYAFEHRCKLAYEGRNDCHFLDFSEEKPEVLREQVLDHLPELKRVNPITKMTIFDYVLPGEEPDSTMNIVQLPRHADLFPHGCDKGTAIHKFCELTGAPLSQCAVFGDSLNDLAMFRACPTAICMAEAPQELIDLSVYHAGTTYGVAEGLRYLFDFT